jgi:hypothetical protein
MLLWIGQFSHKEAFYQNFAFVTGKELPNQWSHNFVEFTLIISFRQVTFTKPKSRLTLGNRPRLNSVKFLPHSILTRSKVLYNQHLIPNLQKFLQILVLMMTYQTPH